MATKRKRKTARKTRAKSEAEDGAPASERAAWKGSIAFGLVHIPVSLQTAERPERIDFDLVDKRDHAPIGYRKVNKETGEEVAQKDIVRAIEAEDGSYVTLTDAEIRAAHAESTHTIEVVQFVAADEVPPQYFARPYWVKPASPSFAKAYALLRDVLARSGKIGIATVVLRTRQHIAALLPQEDLLLLNLLRYAHELRQASGAVDGEAKATAAELKLAEQLVEGMSGKWEPERFKDPTRTRILELVAEKQETGFVKTRARKPQPEGAKIIDLMDLLKASIGETRSAKGPKAAARARPRRKTG